MFRTLAGLVLISLAMVVGTPRAVAQATYKADAGMYDVEVFDETWRDDTRSADPMSVEPGDGAVTEEAIRAAIRSGQRGRLVPVRVYIPVLVAAVIPPGGVNGGANGNPARRPVVVFSHGMGGSREGYEYIARHLATHGYLVVLPQHAGSDRDAILKAGKDKLGGRDEKDEADGKGDGRERGRLGARVRERRATRGSQVLLDITEENTADPANLENRPRDISFVLDRMATHERFSVIADLERVGVAGHSFGAYTTMAACGMRVDLPGRVDATLREKRVKCGIAMSPQGRGVMGVDAGAWDAIDVPMLIATGTKDMGQGERAASWRHEPYAALRSADSYFLNITHAVHMTFSGGGARDRLGQVKQEHLAIVNQCCTAFLDAYLLGDAGAKRWLTDQTIVPASGGACVLEHKGAGSKKSLPAGEGFK